MLVVGEYLYKGENRGDFVQGNLYSLMFNPDNGEIYFINNEKKKHRITLELLDKYFINKKNMHQEFYRYTETVDYGQGRFFTKGNIYELKTDINNNTYFMDNEDEAHGFDREDVHKMFEMVVF